MSAGYSVFVTFGADHQFVLLATTAAAAALVTARRRLQGLRDRWVRRLAAMILLGNELVSLGIATLQGTGRVPIQFCDIALVMTVLALWSLRPLACEVAYFFGLTGSLQAVLTPDLQRGFPDYWWIAFFLSHCGVVVGTVYLALTGRVAPTHRSVWRMWGLTNGYAAFAGLVNWACGTNYGYLARKPSQPSLLDALGPWPWYILGIEVVALGLLYLCYAPFAIARRLSGAQAGHR